MFLCSLDKITTNTQSKLQGHHVSSELKFQLKIFVELKANMESHLEFFQKYPGYIRYIQFIY